MVDWSASSEPVDDGGYGAPDEVRMSSWCPAVDCGWNGRRGSAEGVVKNAGTAKPLAEETGGTGSGAGAAAGVGGSSGWLIKKAVKVGVGELASHCSRRSRGRVASCACSAACWRVCFATASAVRSTSTLSGGGRRGRRRLLRVRTSVWGAAVPARSSPPARGWVRSSASSASADRVTPPAGALHAPSFMPLAASGLDSWSTGSPWGREDGNATGDTTARAPVSGSGICSLRSSSSAKPVCCFERVLSMCARVVMSESPNDATPPPMARRWGTARPAAGGGGGGGG
jgi:hypothetical protein